MCVCVCVIGADCGIWQQEAALTIYPLAVFALLAMSATAKQDGSMCLVYDFECVCVCMCVCVCVYT